MAKIKKAYFCKECGFEAPKWLGHCPSCGAWNSFTEEVIARENASPVTALTGNRPRSKPQRVREIEQSEQRRFDLSCTEVNRVLGGGLIRGSMILLGGEPGHRQIDVEPADRAARKRPENAVRFGRGIAPANQDAGGAARRRQRRVLHIQRDEHGEHPAPDRRAGSRPGCHRLDPDDLYRHDRLVARAASRRSANAPPCCRNTPSRPTRRSS